MATPPEAIVLSALASSDIGSSIEFAAARGIAHTTLVGTLKSLLADEFVALEQLTTITLELTAEGRSVIENGSPEFRLWSAVPESGGVTLAALDAEAGAATRKLGLGPCLKEGWLKKEGDLISRACAAVSDAAPATLRAVEATGVAADEKGLAKRKWITRATRKPCRPSPL